MHHLQLKKKVKKKSQKKITKFIEYKKITEKCTKHGVDKNICFLCDPLSREKGRLWCKEHDRYEDRCFECHPDLEDKQRKFCKTHSLYQDECFYCNTKLSASTTSPKPNTSPILMCNEHKVQESKCGICQPQLAVAMNSGESMKIRFVSKTSAKKAGIKTIRPTATTAPSVLNVFSETSYNKNKMAIITARASGVIKKVYVELGDDIKKGDILLQLNSAEIAEAKRAFLIAETKDKINDLTAKREERLFKENISANKDYLLAVANKEISLLTKKGAYQKLKNYGFSGAEIVLISKNKDSSSALYLRAPFDATVTKRSAVLGQAIKSSDSLFAMVDLSSMWLELSIPVNQSFLIEKKQRVAASFNQMSKSTSNGRIVWVSTLVDPRTRMIKARALLPNKSRKIKSGIFGKANIFYGEIKNKFTLPKNALQIFEGGTYVFIKQQEDLYDFRKVTVSHKNSKTVTVTNGIKKNEDVVHEGTFIIMSEYLKSKLGAGCVDD